MAKDVTKLKDRHGKEVVIFLDEKLDDFDFQQTLTGSFSGDCKTNLKCDSLHFCAMYLAVGVNFHLLDVDDFFEGCTVGDYKHFKHMVVYFDHQIRLFLDDAGVQ